MARVSPTIAVGVLEPTTSVDHLVATGAGAAESAYTEAGPVPGHPEPADGSAYRPAISGAQSVDLRVRSALGTYPGRDALRTLYRLGTDTQSADWRGWDEPATVTGWSAPADGWGTGVEWTCVAACAIPEQGLVIVTACDAAANATTWSYDPRTGTWTALYDWDTGGLDGLVAPLGLTYDAEARRLVLLSGTSDFPGDPTARAYYSDDGGTTWQILSRGWSPIEAQTGSAGSYVTVAYGPDAWAATVVEYVSLLWSGTRLYSYDRGVTWAQVTGSGGGGAGRPVIARGPAGVVQASASGDDSAGTGDLTVTVYSHPAATTGTSVIVDSTRDWAHPCLACDEDGTLYLYARGTAGAGTRDELAAWRSDDGGYTWTRYEGWVWRTASTTDYPEVYCAVACAGAVHLIGLHVGNTTTDGSVGLITLGGWSTVPAGRGIPNATRFVGRGRRESRITWGGTWSDELSTTERTGDLYLPWAMPGALGWTAVTSTGTRTLGPAIPGLELTTTAGQAEDYSTTVTTTSTFSCGWWQGRVYSDSPAIGALSGASVGAAVRPILRNGTYTYAPRIDLGSDGIRVRDGATSRAVVSGLDMDAQDVYIRWHLTKGTIWVWYRLGTGTAWTTLAAGVTVSDTGATSSGDACFFGHVAGLAGHTLTQGIGWASGGDWQRAIDTLAEVGNTPATAPVGIAFGGPVPARGGGYPIPDGTAAGEDLAYLSASGRSYLAEEVDLPAGHTYPIEALHPDATPSPRRVWLSTDDSEVRLVYDAGDSVWRGGAIALAGVGVWGAWDLETSDDGVTWDTLATLDTTEGSVLYERVGSVILPATSTTALPRYYAEDELVGGYVALTIVLGARTVLREITANSAGYWTDDSTVQQVRITLDGIVGTEPTGPATGVIVHPSGVVVAYLTDDAPTRYARVVVAANQGTPGDLYRAGSLGVYRVVGLGAEPSVDAAVTHVQARRTGRLLDGTLTVRRTGPTRRVATYTWPDGTALQDLRTYADGPDRIAAAGAVAIGTREDVAYSLPALVDTLEGGARPAILLRSVPADGVTLTDPTLWLYGRVDVGEVRVRQVAGVEGTSEIVTVSDLVVEEVR